MDTFTKLTDVPVGTCEICKARPRAYTCPRCGISYCSVACYKSEAHTDCSESFYKQCVEDELKLYEGDPESKRRMVNILKRLREHELEDDILEDDGEESDSQLDSDDDETVLDLEERLQNVNLDDADEVWSALTESERQEFEALVKNGEAEELLPEWTPWWTHKIKKVIIQEIDSEQQDSTDTLQHCPPLVDVPEFKDLVKAAPNVQLNLLNVIYAYAYLALYFNGDYMDCAEEAATTFLTICDNMSENKVFQDISSVEESIIRRIVNDDTLPEDSKILTLLKEAVDAILDGPGEHMRTQYLSAALSELHRMLSAAKELMSAQKKAKDSSNFAKKFPQCKASDATVVSKKKLTLCLKKVEYYLSWVKSSSVKSLK